MPPLALSTWGLLAGTYVVTYSVGGPCPASAAQTLTVTTAPQAYSATRWRSSAGEQQTLVPTFAGSASGGTFSAVPAGLSLNPATGVIDPGASAGSGSYTITNTIAASGGCAAAAATARR